MLQVAFTYSAKVLGRHSLPVQLHVTDGRRLRIDLCAEAIEASQQTMHLPGAQEPRAHGTLTLQPVEIGTMQPPMQMFSMRNAGAVTASWALDLGPLEALAAANWGCVLAGLQPSKYRVYRRSCVLAPCTTCAFLA